MSAATTGGPQGLQGPQGPQRSGLATIPPDAADEAEETFWKGLRMILGALVICLLVLMFAATYSATRLLWRWGQ